MICIDVINHVHTNLHFIIYRKTEINLEDQRSKSAKSVIKISEISDQNQRNQ